MLTIQNYYKLCQKKIVGDWTVDFILEEDDEYVIKFVHPRSFSFKVYLQRNKRKNWMEKDTYVFKDNNGIATNKSVTADYIANIDNLIKMLQKFIPDNAHY